MYTKRMLLMAILTLAGASINITNASGAAVVTAAVRDDGSGVAPPVVSRGFAAALADAAPGSPGPPPVEAAAEAVAHAPVGGFGEVPLDPSPAASVRAVANRLLFVAPGTTSALSALEELKFVERAAGRPIGEIFTAGAGVSLAGSFVVAALFTRNATGQYRSVDEAETLFRTNLGGLMLPKTGFLCIPAKHSFDKDRLRTTLGAIFGTTHLSDVEKPIFVHARMRQTDGTAGDEYVFSSSRARTDARHDYSLADVIASAATTKGLYKSRVVTSRGGVARRMLGAVPYHGAPTTALPSLLAFHSTVGGDTDDYAVMSVGHVDRSFSLDEPDRGARAEALRQQRYMRLLLRGDRYARIGITHDPIATDPHGNGEDTVRALIQRSNPAQVPLRGALARGMYNLGLATHEQVHRCSSFVRVMTTHGPQEISRERYLRLMAARAPVVASPAAASASLAGLPMTLTASGPAALPPPPALTARLAPSADAVRVVARKPAPARDTVSAQVAEADNGGGGAEEDEGNEDGSAARGEISLGVTDA